MYWRLFFNILFLRLNLDWQISDVYYNNEFVNKIIFRKIIVYFEYIIQVRSLLNKPRNLHKFQVRISPGTLLIKPDKDKSSDSVLEGSLHPTKLAVLVSSSRIFFIPLLRWSHMNSASGSGYVAYINKIAHTIDTPFKLLHIPQMRSIVFYNEGLSIALRH